MALPAQLTTSVDGIPAWLYAVRLFWIVVQLGLIICLGQKGVLFFYQAF